MKKLLFIPLILILVVGFYVIRTFQEEEHLQAQITIEDMDMSNLNDGTYEGSYDTKLIHVTVEVTLKAGKIQFIDILKHDNGKGGAAEEITHTIIKTNSLNVDSVSGATSSSLVIRKAIEQALLKARKDSL